MCALLVILRLRLRFVPLLICQLLLIAVFFFVAITRWERMCALFGQVLARDGFVEGVG